MNLKNNIEMKKDDKGSLYDRLGDLLSETLQSGHVNFIRLEEESDSDSPKESEKPNKEKSQSSFTKEDDPKNNFNFESSTKSQKKEKKVIYKKITPEISQAYRLLDITPSASLDDLKKAYKEKIKYYHPDKYQNNPIMAKVATDKTRQVVEAFNLLSDFINN